MAVCYKKGYGNRWGAWMGIQNMYLAATAEGLGIVPSELMGVKTRMPWKTCSDCRRDYKLAAMALVGRQKGYPKVPKVKRRKEWSWLHRNRFGARPNAVFEIANLRISTCKLNTLTFKVVECHFLGVRGLSRLFYFFNLTDPGKIFLGYQFRPFVMKLDTGGLGMLRRQVDI